MSLFLEPAITYLDWDTAFFGHRIGKITVDEQSNVNALLTLGQLEKYDLLYVFSRKEQGENWLPYLVDVKVNSKLSYHRKGNSPNESIQKISSPLFENELKELVLLNGIHSRFFKDKRLKEHYNRLYTQWAEICFDFENYNTYYSIQNNQLAGFATVQKQDRFQVQLSTVHPDFRSQGIAERLWRYAFEDMAEEKYTDFFISFQNDNIPARKLYDKLGFIEEEKFFVYHLWT